MEDESQRQCWLNVFSGMKIHNNVSKPSQHPRNQEEAAVSFISFVFKDMYMTSKSKGFRLCRLGTASSNNSQDECLFEMLARHA